MSGSDKVKLLNGSCHCPRHHHSPHHIAEVPEDVMKLAYQEYHKRHPTQSYERILERGGFSIGEIIYWIHEHIKNSNNNL